MDHCKKNCGFREHSQSHLLISLAKPKAQIMIPCQHPPGQHLYLVQDINHGNGNDNQWKRQATHGVYMKLAWRYRLNERTPLDPQVLPDSKTLSATSTEIPNYHHPVIHFLGVNLLRMFCLTASVRSTTRNRAKQEWQQMTSQNLQPMKKKSLSASQSSHSNGFLRSPCGYNVL